MRLLFKLLASFHLFTAADLTVYSSIRKKFHTNIFLFMIKILLKDYYFIKCRQSVLDPGRAEISTNLLISVLGIKPYFSRSNI